MSNTMQWLDLIKRTELEPDDVTAVRSGSQTYAVYDAIDGICVTTARCSHAGANLCDGYFDGRNIECPLHQGLFDARTGRAKAAPATRPLQTYEARVQDGMVQIKIRSTECA